MIGSRTLRRAAVAGLALSLFAMPAIAQRDTGGGLQQGQQQPPPPPLPGPLDVQKQPQQQQPAPMPQLPANAGGLVQRLSAEDLMAVLRDLGYKEVQKRTDTTVLYAAGGERMVCFIERNGDLRLYWSVRKRIAPQRTNDWNRDKRLSRAFIDKQGEPVLETDLLAAAGVTRAQVAATFRTFEQSVKEFKGYLGVR